MQFNIQYLPQEANKLVMVTVKDYKVDHGIYHQEHGVIKRYFQFVDPRHWQEHVEQNTMEGKERYQGSDDRTLLRRALYYRDNEYTKEFMEGRFAFELNTFMPRFEQFDQGAIWVMLQNIERILVRHIHTKPVLGDKDLTRICKSMNETISAMDYSIGFVCKLIKIVRSHALLFPDTIQNVAQYTAQKAYVIAAYLCLLNLKERLSPVVLPEGYDLINMFITCLPWNLHTFEVSYDNLYPSNSEVDLNMIVTSPGREPNNSK